MGHGRSSALVCFKGRGQRRSFSLRNYLHAKVDVHLGLQARSKRVGGPDSRAFSLLEDEPGGASQDRGTDPEALLTARQPKNELPQHSVKGC